MLNKCKRIQPEYLPIVEVADYQDKKFIVTWTSALLYNNFHSPSISVPKWDQGWDQTSCTEPSYWASAVDFLCDSRRTPGNSPCVSWKSWHFQKYDFANFERAAREWNHQAWGLHPEGPLGHIINLTTQTATDAAGNSGKLTLRKCRKINDTD